MKHLFMINPMSGKGKGADMIIPKIKEALAKRELDSEIYVSKSAQAACDYAKAQAAKGEPIRVYACGGDGTIFDIVNAIYGYKNAEFAAIPLGSGNDFIRLFGTKEQFLDELKKRDDCEIVEELEDATDIEKWLDKQMID